MAWLHRQPVARSLSYPGHSINSPLPGSRPIYADACRSHRGINVIESRRRQSSSAGPKNNPYTKDEVGIVRDAHASGKNRGEILELLGNRNLISLQDIYRKAIGSCRASRHSVRKDALTARRPWTQSELKLLKLWVSEGRTHWRMAGDLGRAINSIHPKVARLDQADYPLRPWSSEETSLLQTLILQAKPVAAMAQDLGRTVNSVAAKLYSLNLGPRGKAKSSNRRWTEEDEQTIEKYYRSGCTDKVIAKRLTIPATLVDVKRKRQSMGLTTWKFQTSVKHRPWSNAELDELRALAEKGLPISAFAAHLTTKRSESAIRSRLLHLGIEGLTTRSLELWTDSEVSTLRTLHERGLSAKAIRDALPTSRTLIAVKTKKANLGLYFTKGRGKTQPTKKEDTTETTGWE